MTKAKIIETLNETDDFKALGFEIAADDGCNQYLTKKWGAGVMCLNRWCEKDIDPFFHYSEDVGGWDSN